MRMLVAVLALASVAGCSSDPISLGEAVRAPSDHVYAFQSAPSGLFGKITVLRDGGINASACDFVIYLNGTKAAKLGSGEKVSFFVDQGPVNIGVGLAGVGLCSGQAIRTLSANSTQKTETVFRVSSDMTGVTIGPYVEYR